MAKTYLCEFLTILAFVTVFISCESFSPYMTALIMRYISHREDYESYYGALLFGLTILLQIIKALCMAQMGYRFTKLGVNLTNSLTLLIFTKSLRYPSIAEKEFRES